MFSLQIIHFDFPHDKHVLLCFQGINQILNKVAVQYEGNSNVHRATI